MSVEFVVTDYISLGEGFTKFAIDDLPITNPDEFLVKLEEVGEEWEVVYGENTSPITIVLGDNEVLFQSDAPRFLTPGMCLRPVEDITKDDRGCFDGLPRVEEITPDLRLVAYDKYNCPVGWLTIEDLDNRYKLDVNLNLCGVGETQSISGSSYVLICLDGQLRKLPISRLMCS